MLLYTPEKKMSDNVAILEGYTQEVEAKHIENDEVLYLLVKPNIDYKDYFFQAWNMDLQEFVWVKGSMYTFTEVKVEKTLPEYHIPQNQDFVLFLGNEKLTFNWKLHEVKVTHNILAIVDHDNEDEVTLHFPKE
jgi:hypothetical protein